MARYWKLFWCNMIALILFVVVLLSLQAATLSPTIRAVGIVADMLWFFPLSMFLFDRQLKAEESAGLHALVLRR